MILDLFTRCVLISLLAFGGGAAALPLIERIAVGETGWVSSQDFAMAVAFGYITPGPVLITPAVVGLLVVTALHLARTAFSSGVYAGIAGVALVLALWTKLHPIVILLGGAVVGTVYGLLKGIETLQG